MTTINCLNCGIETIDRTNNNKKKYCSKICKNKSFTLNRKKLPKAITKHCELCDKVFVDVCDHKKQ